MKREKEAIRHISQQGFDCFFPQMVEFGKDNKPILTPLFHNYFFVMFRFNDMSWRSIPYSRGVKKLLMADAETPLPLPIGFVEKLQLVYDEDRLILRPPKPGEMGKVVDGVFKDLEGICQLNHKGRIQLLLSLLGAPRLTTLSEGHVIFVG